MRTLIIYTSQTGFTKKYAEWIAEKAKADILDLKNAQKKNFSSLDFKTKLILIGKIWKSFQPQSKNVYLFGVYILQEKKCVFF